MTSISLNKYQCYIDGKAVFNKPSDSWQDALKRAILWRDYSIKPFKVIEILNIWTGKRYSLDECIKRANLFLSNHVYN